MKINILGWAFGAFMLPLFRAIEKDKGEVTLNTQLMVSIYGYLVLCGLVFNLACVIAIVLEIVG